MDEILIMENRFGLKDLIVIVLLLGVLVSVWLKVIADDRQWELLQSIDQRLADIAQNPGVISGPVTVSTVTETDNEKWEGTLFERWTKPQGNPDFARGDWYVDAFAAAVGKLTPLIATDVYQSRIENFVLEPLIQRDPETFKWKPRIASDWRVSEDGLEITFDLREDVRFSDGVLLTSADVVFTYDMIMNPDVNTPRLKTYYEIVESVEADGPYRVKFRLKRPYFQSLSITGGMAIMPKHYYEQFSPDEFNASTGLLFGSGPYKLPMDPEDWEPGTGQVELVRNENYWGPKPALERLIWREIPDETARLTSLRNGDIDQYVVRPERYVRLKEDKFLKERADLFEYEVVTSGYRYLAWNQVIDGKPTPFADKRVRQAMTYLTNRHEMAEQLMVGLATPASGPFHRLGDQVDPDLKVRSFDLEKAEALLVDAGFIDRDGDGVRENENGEPLSFKLVYPSSSKNYELMAFYLKDAYAKAGVVLEPDPTEWNTMIQKIDERNFQAITLGWGGSIETDPNQIFHSDSIGDGGDNFVSYSNLDLDKLIDEARQQMDPVKRRELWHQVHAILYEDQPYTFLFNSRSVVFVDKRVRNVAVTRGGLNDLTERYVPRNEQRYTQ